MLATRYEARRVGRLFAWLGASLTLLAGAGMAADDGGDPTIRDGFESTRVAWSREQTDGTITLLEHDRSPRAAHEGRKSEHFRFQAGLGSAFYYSYAVPRVAVADDLRLGLFVRANRPGVQVFARVVLPTDIDPDTKAPSFLLVPGTIYDNIDRWQRLELAELRPALERQARVLRASSKRAVKLDGAYIEQVIVNLFAGPGETDVYLDELSIGPVSPTAKAAHLAAMERRDAAAAALADGAELKAGDPNAAAIEGNGEGEAAAPTASGRPAAEAGRVRLDRNALKRRAEDGLYHDWIFTAIRAPGADLGSLRSAGFDVLIDEANADPARWREAVSRGFLLMPRLERGPEGVLPDPAQAAAAASGFAHRGSVVAWHLGDHLGHAADARARQEELERARALISAFRTLPEGTGRLTTATIDDDLPRYARGPRNLDLLGIRPTAWASSMDFLDTYRYLKQRRDLTVRSNAGALYWAHLPATAPAELTRGVWGRDVPPSWGFPTVQPEQLRLMTYLALAAGYRGIAYEADAEITRGNGRMLLLEMGLLNAEIDLFESILANGVDPIPTYPAYDPDPPNVPPPGGRFTSRVARQAELKPLPGIMGAAVGTRDRKGVLLLIGDYGNAGQYQPAQMARNEMKMTVIVPEGAQAFEVSPGHVRVLQRERHIGGTRVTLPEFDTTALVLITTDVAMAERIEAVVNSIRPRAAQMAIEQAEMKLAWVTEINGRLAADGHLLIQERERRRREANGGSEATDQADLLAKAAENIKAARENLEREDFSGAWLEARRASRPLRILMRGLWDNAALAMIKANMDPADLANEEALRTGRARRKGPPLIVPAAASTPLASFNLLPQHYLWVDMMQKARFGKNLIPSGAFDEPDGLESGGWAAAGYQVEGVVGKVTTVPWQAPARGRYVKMSVRPAEGKTYEDLPPFLDQPVAAIRSPAVKVGAGHFLRISVYVQRPYASADGAGGVVVRDSIGGEALQFRSSAPMPSTTRVVLYRRAPAEGELTVTLGLAGYGDVIFDELTVERVESVPEFEAPDIARLPSPDRPAAATPLR